MRLSLMQAIDSTIADSGESPLADQLLIGWPHDSGSARFLRMSANAVFSFTHAQRPCILRFNHETERNAEQLHTEVAYLQHLFAAGIPVAKPMPSLADRYVESVNTPYGWFHSVVFEAIAGQQLDIDALSLEQFGQWGQALGRLHRAAQSYAGTGRPMWSDRLIEAMEYLPTAEREAHEAIAKLHAQLTTLPVDAETFGLIHYDFELDNLIWTPQELVAIDFDDSTWCWFAADIAFALRDLFDDEVAKINTNTAPFRAFIEGYRREKPLTAEAIALLPLFLRLHHALGFATLLRSLEIVPRTQPPPWAVALRQKLETMAQQYRNEFVIDIC